jgi:3-oxoacyl-[acyl-carrier-protein] synthase III
MKASYARIVGWGRHVPANVVTNHDLTRLVDTTDEWIRGRTGIVERRMVGPQDTTSSLGIVAAQAALEMAKVDPKDVELVIVATVSPEYLLPATASIVQAGIGASKAGAFDLNAGCSGFVYALAVASRMIESGAHKNVLVVGAEAITRLIDFTDRGTCVLFGDGAGAIVLQASSEPTGLLSCVLGSDGSGADSLIVPAGGSHNPASVATVEGKQHFVKMKGNEVYRFAVSAMTQASREAITQAGLQPEDIDLFVPHQANLRIIQSAARNLKLPPEKVFINVERYGNTSAASIPIALTEAVEQGRLHPGDRVVMVGFGAGLTWAAAVVQWGVGARVGRSLRATVAEAAPVHALAGAASAAVDDSGRRNGRTDLGADVGH